MTRQQRDERLQRVMAPLQLNIGSGFADALEDEQDVARAIDPDDVLVVDAETGLAYTGHPNGGDEHHGDLRAEAKVQDQ